MCFAAIGCRSAKEGYCGSCIKGKTALEEKIAADFGYSLQDITIRRVNEFTIQGCYLGQIVAQVNRGEYKNS